MYSDTSLPCAYRIRGTGRESNESRSTISLTFYKNQKNMS
nr:MAG TPA: hypothetical protein [Caudoviricetes sp.]